MATSASTNTPPSDEELSRVRRSIKGYGFRIARDYPLIWAYRADIAVLQLLFLTPLYVGLAALMTQVPEQSRTQTASSFRTELRNFDEQWIVVTLIVCGISFLVYMTWLFLANASIRNPYSPRLRRVQQIFMTGMVTALFSVPILIAAFVAMAVINANTPSVAAICSTLNISCGLDLKNQAFLGTLFSALLFLTVFSSIILRHSFFSALLSIFSTLITFCALGAIIFLTPLFAADIIADDTGTRALAATYVNVAKNIEEAIFAREWRVFEVVFSFALILVVHLFLTAMTARKSSRLWHKLFAYFPALYGIIFVGCFSFGSFFMSETRYYDASDMANNPIWVLWSALMFFATLVVLTLYDRKMGRSDMPV